MQFLSSRSILPGIALLSLVAAGACGDGAGGTSVAGSGGTGTGGSQAMGGATGSGGSSAYGSGGEPGSGGTSATGGTQGSGGATARDAGAMGGNATGGRDAGATGGTTTATGGRDAGAMGGNATGGSSARGGTSGSGGTSATGGGTGGAGTLFSECRFHFGAMDSVSSTSIRSEIDYFTSGWVLGVNFNHNSVCTESASGGTFAGKLPVQVAYIAADYVKHTHNLCDCNVTSCGSSGGRANDLCNYGAQYITQEWANILNLYKSNSDGFANCMGGRPIVFEMEPDWYQYTISNQNQPWSASQAGTNMTALVNAMKTNANLKAYFSIDISPWIPNEGANWYSSFDLGLFTFANTSGGGTDANNTKIRANNAMTWAGVNKVTGKPILADTGYGAAGASAGEDPNWNVAANINARMADGVISICQYNPTSSWGSTISGIRSQLNKPRYCP